MTVDIQINPSHDPRPIRQLPIPGTVWRIRPSLSKMTSMPSSNAIRPKGSPVRTAGAAAWVESYLISSIGQKIIVAFTGLLLVGFLIGHLIGNLKMFSGAESLNRYAAFLKHDIGALLWIARGGLLGVFVAHIFIAIRLKMRTSAARPIEYARLQNAQATAASKSMIRTGLVIAAFTLFHLAHYTFGIAHNVQTSYGTVNYMDLKDVHGQHDVYRMVIAGFTTWWISVFYLIAQFALFVHLSHGIPSSLSTFGLVNRRFAVATKLLGFAVAGSILAGNVAIVVAVWTGIIK